MTIAPAFRLSVTPFGSGQDPLSATLHVHRVALPELVQYGYKGQPLTPNPTYTLAELLAEVERVASGLDIASRQASDHAEPLSLPVVNGRIVLPEKVP